MLSAHIELKNVTSIRFIIMLRLFFSQEALRQLASFVEPCIQCWAESLVACTVGLSLCTAQLHYLCAVLSWCCFLQVAMSTAWLQVKGDILYNGKDFSQFFVERSAGYVEQTDQHYAPLTVRETFDFAAWCQGTGYRRGGV